MARRARTPGWAIALAAAALLGGCGEGGPARDASGAIDESSETRLIQLRAGDCMGNLRDALLHPDGGHNGVPKVKAVKCSNAHDAEILRVTPLRDGPWPEYPVVDGEAARGRLEIDARVKRIRQALGPLTLVSFRPSQPRWDFEDQHAIYFVALYDKPQRKPAPD